jgi:HK97 family phage prohead protease
LAAVTRKRETFESPIPRLAVLPAVEGKPVTLSGYALVFGVLSTDRGGYRVRLLPGSPVFAAEVHALWNHEYRDVIGTTNNGTLRYSEDNVGVRVEIDLPNTNAGRDVAELVRRGDVRGMSFGIPDEPTYTETTVDGLKVRDYSRFTVDEVTITPIPAFAQTIIGIKGAAAPPATIGYANRTKASLTLQKFKIDSLRLREAQILAPVR